MNDFWKSILGGLARAGLATASGYAVAHGTITADDAQGAMGAAGALFTAIWSVVQKIRAR